MLDPTRGHTKIIGKDLKPAYASYGDDDAELENAARQPFTALDYAMRTGRHHPKLWAVIQGSPFENEYRRRFKV